MYGAWLALAMREGNVWDVDSAIRSTGKNELVPIVWVVSHSQKGTDIILLCKVWIKTEEFLQEVVYVDRSIAAVVDVGTIGETDTYRPKCAHERTCLDARNCSRRTWSSATMLNFSVHLLGLGTVPLAATRQ